MDSNALITRKKAKKICCDLLALVDRGTKKTMSFLRVQPIFISRLYSRLQKKSKLQIETKRKQEIHSE